MNQNRGFTVVELVTVIIILGILSALTLPRFFSKDTFTDSFARSEFENALAWARNRAITSHCTYEVRLTDSGWTVYRDSACSTTISEAACGSETLNFSVTATDSTGITLSGDSPFLDSRDSPQRLIFTATGELAVNTTLPSTAGCTSYPSTFAANSSTISLLPAKTLSLDGSTAYVEIQ